MKAFKNIREKTKKFFIKLKNKDTSFFIIALCVLLLSTALIWRYSSKLGGGDDLAEENESGISTDLDPYDEFVQNIMDEYDNSGQETAEANKIDLKGMNAPLAGEVIREYSIDGLVYYETIGEWRVHKGVDIKPKDSLMIESAFAGTVEKVTSSELNGTEIVIDHGNNVKTVYHNLSSTKVETGDKVEKGQEIGNVGKVDSIEAADGPHLHFELIVEGKNVNPLDYIPGE
jgi:murein DD-endopeptidase MepM/ murein hydrolase activator NlpD